MAYTACMNHDNLGSVSSVWDGCALSSTMVMHYENQAAMYIANNSIFHERAKHILRWTGISLKIWWWPRGSYFIYYFH